MVRNFVILSLFIAFGNAYKVLFLAPMSVKSHFLYTSSFVRALLDRGHEVTYLTSNSLSNLNPANYTEVLIDPPLDVMSKVPQEVLIKKNSASVFSSIHNLNYITKQISEYAYENSNVQKFIKSTGLYYDVIVIEDFFTDSFLMFAHKYKAPVVAISPFGITEFIDRQQGLLSSPSFVPHYKMPYSDNMSFIERWYNTIVVAYEWIVRNFSYLPSEEELAKKHFAHLAPLPSLSDLIHNVSLVLVNTHRAISPPRPSMPNVIPIGGAHIKPANRLPKDLQQFLDDSKDGAIYFSLGTNIKSAKMSKLMITAFLDTFKNLKQRVLWKFEDESLTDIPPNVLIRKWMPQNDILAHSNVVLFISHGGAFGTTESLYHGVPLLLIPFFGDQFRNAYQIFSAGYGKFINHQEITTESFAKAVNEILSDKTYLTKAKQTSAVFKDNLVHPMDESMFWIEHVAKFKGAKHLKSHAVNMSWFTYLLLDIALVNVFMSLTVVLLLRALIKKLFQKTKTEKLSQKKKQK